MVKARLICLELMMVAAFIIMLPGCAASAKKKGKEPPVKFDRVLAEEVIRKAKENSIQRIAVLEFPSIDGETSDEGRLLAERMISNIVTEGSISVIERNSIDRILEEQKLQASGVIDSSTAKEIGMVLGVDAILMGTVVVLENKSEVQVRLVKVQTGLIVYAVTRAAELEFSGGSSNRYAAMKKNEPKKYRAFIKKNRKLIKMREKNPDLFRRLMNTRKRLFRLAKEEPGKFIRMMGPDLIIPIGAKMMGVKKTIELLRTCCPDDYEKLYKLRKEILDKEKEKEDKLLYKGGQRDYRNQKKSRGGGSNRSGNKYGDPKYNNKRY